MKSLYRGAQTAVTFARLVNAAFHGALAVLFAGFALWLALPLGRGWLLDIIAIYFGLLGAAIGVKGLEIFLSTKSQERPDERERYLQSRSLYNPGSRREAARRERES
jgi:fatty acid desaturase